MAMSAVLCSVDVDNRTRIHLSHLINKETISAVIVYCIFINDRYIILWSMYVFMRVCNDAVG